MSISYSNVWTDSWKPSVLTVCHTARRFLDLFRVLQQPPGCVYGALQADEGRPLSALLRGLPPAPADDRHRHRRLPPHPGAEDLQVSAAAGRAAQVHSTGPQVTHTENTVWRSEADVQNTTETFKQTDICSQGDIRLYTLYHMWPGAWNQS